MQNVDILSPQMKVNVESILNPVVSDTYATSHGVSSNIKITETPKATCYHIDVEFFNQLKSGQILGDRVTAKNTDSGSFSFAPYLISHIRIEQQFADSYLNHYELKVTLTVDQYQLLFYNYKDLRCTIRFYAADTTGKIYGKTESGDPVLQIENAYCIFKDKQDILKQTPKSSVIPESNNGKDITSADQLIDVVFQIIPQEDYKFRVSKCNMILNCSTVADAIRMIANSNDHCIDALMMVEPDNKMVYKNIVIPPILSLPDALKFLQEHYGVYSKGMGYYYQVGCLYVYPLYETNPILPKDKSPDMPDVYTKNKYATVTGNVLLDEMGDGGMTHIYMVGNNSYVGMQYYHAYEGRTIHIVSNGQSIFRDLADSGMENAGYGYITHHSERDIDMCRSVLEADNMYDAMNGIWPINIFQNPNNSYLATDGQNRHIGMTSTQANVKYVDDKSNVFTVQSNIYSYMRCLAGVEWNNAVPFTFRPGYRVCYHYDGEDESRRTLTSDTGSSLQYMTKNGTVEDVNYTFMRTASNPSMSKDGTVEPGNVFVCKAGITVSLENDTTDHQEGI